jgi:sulfide:quinone oxidoreductase
MHVVIAGAGFGGLELATRLSEEFGDEAADVVLIDRAEGFVFGFSKLGSSTLRRRLSVRGSTPW